jgi:hypothetical protein
MSTTEATGTYRLLIVAAETVDADEIRKAIAERAQGRDAEVRLVVPAIEQSKLEHVMGDVDEATEAARKRLERSAEALRRAGIEPADARVGDSDLKLAISDALAGFPADEILIVAHSGDGPSFERQWIEEAEREFEQPITEIFVDRGDSGEARVVDVERKPAGQTRADPGEVEGESRNMPPFSPRDVLGIVVAIVGTIVLVVLAATGNDNLNSEGGFGAPSEGGISGQTVRIIIAGAMALVNLAHVVGLTLFQAGPYRGFGRDLFAKLSLYGTPVAILASVLLLIAD